MPRKTEKLSIRVDPLIKDALQKAADIEHRSIANMVEILIRDHCRKNGIEIEGVSSVPEKAARKKARR